MNYKNSCIAILVGLEERDRFDLEECLSHLYVFFNKKYQYDVLIFHENLTNEYISSLYDKPYMRMPIKTIQIQLPIPENTKGLVAGSKPGYRAMCKWFSGDFFFMSSLMKYKYCWHFDTDSRLMGELDFDPFLFMAINNMDFKWFIRKLNLHAKDFGKLQTNSLKPTI